MPQSIENRIISKIRGKGRGWVSSQHDFAGMGKDPTTRDKWWPLTDACQIRLPGTQAGQQWKPIEQVMHID